MQKIWALYLCVSLISCGEKKRAEPPATKPSLNKNIIATTTLSSSPATSIAASTSAPATSMASAPTTAPAALIASLRAPAEPAPAKGLIDHDKWLGISGFPAVSEDGRTFASVTYDYVDPSWAMDRGDAAEYNNEKDELEAQGKEMPVPGYTVWVEITDVDSGKQLEKVELLSPTETTSEGGEALAKIRSELAPKVALRVEEAKKMLAKTRWLAYKTWDRYNPGDVEISFEELHLVIKVKGVVVKDEMFPKWRVKPTRPCKENEFGTGCGCDYPVILSDVRYSTEARLMELYFGHQIDHQCEEPPEGHSLTVRYTTP